MTTKKEIEVLSWFVNEEPAKELIQRRDKIAAVTGVHISILEFDLDAKKIKFRVEQKKLINNWILSQYQLVTRVKELFKGVIPGDYKTFYSVLTFNPNLDEIDFDWVASRMSEFGITNADIIKHLNIDKSTLSLMQNRERGLTKSQKSAFMYYFMVFEINCDMR